MTSTAFTGLPSSWNGNDGYPTAPKDWPLEAQEVAVIGGGNVAMDVARLLMRQADDLLPLTSPDNVYQGVKANKARVLHMFVRRGPAQAKLAVQELREMEKLPGVQIIVNDADFDLDPATLAKADEDKLTRQMLAELNTIRDMAREMAERGGTDFEGNPAERKYYIHFYQMPAAILGEDGKVTGIRVEHTSVDPDGRMSETGQYSEYQVQAVYHAIGYKPAQVAGIPYDFDATHAD